ncbi:hypothetical protein F2Q69_00052095 [Brassica cretica]|uniref:Uncharacterized protein n=1 Tax=Brassica cretica TaxID=69181 RepID=A0A8S9MN09_BRACR|nr:hypothetical protein F2Q69_00052095 [Brassica cretica]
MLDRVLLGQQQITVDFNDWRDNKGQEAFTREAGADKRKHHVNAIIDDDFLQVVRHEKLEEGDFEIESSMSLGGSQWCRPMLKNSHRSTDHDKDRWMDYSSHRSTSSAESTECNAVRILTHEEFAAKHPHPPSPFYDKIDRLVEPTIDRQPPPKPLASPPEPKPNPLNSSPEPVQEDQETEGRRLRKIKEKIPKNLNREANDKEMDGFTKRVLRIPIEKAFDEAYFTHRLSMFFRETKVTKEDIRYSLVLQVYTTPAQHLDSTWSSALNTTSASTTTSATTSGWTSYIFINIRNFSPVFPALPSAASFLWIRNGLSLLI